MSEPRTEHGTRAGDRATAGAISMYLLASASVLFWFGLQDVFGETSYGVRLRAAAMIALSAYLLISAFAVGVVLFKGSVAASAVALTGGTLGALTGAILLVYQLVGGDHTRWIWAWLGMFVGGVLVAVRLLNAGARFPYPKQFAAAVTVTSLLGGANFTYNSLYQPTAQPTQIGLNVNIAEPALNSTGTIASIPVTVSFINSGKVGLHVVTAIFSVVGRRGSIASSEQTPGQMLGAIQNGRPASNAAQLRLVRLYILLRPGGRSCLLCVYRAAAEFMGCARDEDMLLYSRRVAVRCSQNSGMHSLEFPCG